LAAPQAARSSGTGHSLCLGGFVPPAAKALLKARPLSRCPSSCAAISPADLGDLRPRDDALRWQGRVHPRSVSEQGDSGQSLQQCFQRNNPAISGPAHARSDHQQLSRPAGLTDAGCA
jgi:hypothetical protein